jgi:hypothetical protein
LFLEIGLADESGSEAIGNDDDEYVCSYGDGVSTVNYISDALEKVASMEMMARRQGAVLGNESRTQPYATLRYRRVFGGRIEGAIATWMRGLPWR